MSREVNNSICLDWCRINMTEADCASFCKQAVEDKEFYRLLTETVSMDVDKLIEAIDDALDILSSIIDSSVFNSLLDMIESASNSSDKAVLAELLGTVFEMAGIESMDELLYELLEYELFFEKLKRLVTSLRDEYRSKKEQLGVGITG
ncbi:MAG: hypothetical protein QXW39_08100 [Candidatus Bathyarchaeia archaeon]|uniref:hypothetical protein n=1 Tax=Thermofilum sp. TaxID=1961369 RepID=UPI0031667544